MTKKEKLSFAAIIIFLFGGLLIAAYLARQITRPRPKAAPNNITFEFISSSPQPTVNEEFLVSIFATAPQSLQVGNIAAYIKFDQNTMDLLEITPGNEAPQSQPPFSSWTYARADQNPNTKDIEIIAGYSGANSENFLDLEQTALFAVIKFRWKETSSNEPIIVLETMPQTSAKDPQGSPIAADLAVLSLPTLSPLPATPTPAAPEIPVPDNKTALYIPQSPASTEIISGTEFNVPIYLNTANKNAAGVDAVINFDPTALEFVSYEKGNITEFFQYLANNDEESKVSVSAIISPDTTQDFEVLSDSENQTPVNGQNLLFATLTFKALPIYSIDDQTQNITTQLNFDFTAGSKNDSNIAEYETGADILELAAGADYTILPSTQTGTNAQLKLKLYSCSEPNLLPVKIVFDNETSIQTTLNSSNITNDIAIPLQTAKLKVYPAGYLPAEFEIPAARNNIIDLSGHTFLGGDLDEEGGFGNGRVNTLDAAVFIRNFNSTTDKISDFDCSEKVTTLDFAQSFIKSWGKCSNFITDRANCND